MTGEEFLGDEIACPRCRRELRRPVELVEATDLAPGDQLRSAGRLLIVDRVIERAPLLDTSPWRWAVHLVGEGGRPVVLVGRQKVERVLPRS